MFKELMVAISNNLQKILNRKMSRKEFIGLGAVAVASIFGFSGVIKGLLSQAATPTVSAEPEVGAVTAGAAVVTDASASAGSAIKFSPLKPNNWPALPNYPTVKWETLYTTGETPIQTLAKVRTMGTIVLLPDGFDAEISTDPMLGPENANMLMYFPNIRGFIGAGSSKSRFRIKPNRYSFNFTTMRLMPGANGQNVNAGWHLAGTDQLAIAHSQSATTHPANTSGYVLYQGRDAIFQDFKISGFQGDWNSPPGETFQLNLFKDINTKIYGLEVDGYNINGKLVGGSPVGLNNSKDVEIYDSYLHDAFVSGPTASFAGSWLPEKSSSGWKTFNCRMHRNANWGITSQYGYDYGASGKRFAGINHENVYGTVIHERTNFITNKPTSYWDAGHVSIVHHVNDNPDIHIIEPTWDSLHPKMNGAFMVSMSNNYGGAPNAQVSPPEVIKNGTRLQPFFQNGNPATTLPVNPATQFVVLGSDRRG